MAKVTFNEGALAKQLADTGWPSAGLKAHLSTRGVSGAGTLLTAVDTKAGGFAAITGTGYAAITATEPASDGSGTKVWVFTFNTGAATDWSNAVRSVVFEDVAGAKLFEAQDLSVARDMSAAGSTLTVTLTTTSAVA